jgi:hypothetical protein
MTYVCGPITVGLLKTPLHGARFLPQDGALNVLRTMDMSMTKCALAAALVAVSGLSGCALNEKGLTEKGMKPLADADLKALYARDRTFSWKNDRGASGTGEYRADGSTTVAWGTGSAQGRYRIAGSQFCTTYTGIRAGAENCVRIYRTADNQFMSFYNSGEWNATFSFSN